MVTINNVEYEFLGGSNTSIEVRKPGSPRVLWFFLDDVSVTR
jgi:hypothetical protein